MKFIIALFAVVASVVAEPQFLAAGALPYAHTIHGPSAISYTAAAPALTYAAAPAPVVTYAAAPAPAVIAAPAVSSTRYHAQDELGQASYGHAEPGQAHAAVRDAAGNVRGSYAYINPDGNEIRVDYTAGHGGFQVASNALPVAPPAGQLDTPEVAHAKAAHFAAVAEARARNAAADLADGVVISRKKRGIASTYVSPLYTAAPAIPLTYATSYSYRYDAPRFKTVAIAPAPVVKTYVAAPVVKTIAPAPIVKTYVSAPVVRTIAPAPIFKTYAAAPVVKTYAAAPIIKTAPVITYHAAPIVKTIAPAPIVRTIAPAPIVKTYAHAYAAAPLRTYSYAPTFYSHTPYAYNYGPAYGYNYGYTKFLG